MTLAKHTTMVMALKGFSNTICIIIYVLNKLDIMLFMN